MSGTLTRVWAWLRGSRGATPADVSPRPSAGVSFSIGGPSASFALNLDDALADHYGTGPSGGALAPRITRREALQVPAVLRGRNLIAGTLATLPLRAYDTDRVDITDGHPLFRQLDDDLPNSVTLSMLYEDLLFESESWCVVTRRGYDGYPMNIRHVPREAVTVSGTPSPPSRSQITPDSPYPIDGQVFVDGRPVTDADVIRFDSPNPPVLRHAARAIRTALALDRAASRYTDEPLPLGYFAPREGVDPSRADVEAMLDDWETARARRMWGYVGAAVDAKTLQWNPEQLQLADQRQHAVLEIARAMGIDPEDLGVSTTSRTYANAEQRRLDLLDFTLAAYVHAVEDRLTMGDVLPRGKYARVDMTGFLRSDAKTRMDTYQTGLAVGAYTHAEIRQAENRPDLSPLETPPMPGAHIAPVPAEPSPNLPPKDVTAS